MTFSELLAATNIPTRTERPGWVQLTCPGCRRPWYLGYNTRGGYFHCWKCGHLKLYETADALGLDVRELRGLGLERTLPPANLIPRGHLTLPAHLAPIWGPHRGYLRRRGFVPDPIVRLWGIQGTGPYGPLKWRIFIPIHYRGKMVSWTTRKISDAPGGLRYVSAGAAQEELPHKELLYGEDAVRHGIVICEGPLDAWAIGPGAVATCGVSYSGPQLAAMARYPVRAVCFDSEAGAQKRARRLLDDLATFPGTTTNIVLDAKDPATAPKRDIQRIRKEFLE